MRPFLASLLGCGAAICTALVLSGFVPGDDLPVPQIVAATGGNSTSAIVTTVPTSSIPPSSTAPKAVVQEHDGGVLVIGDSILESLHLTNKAFGYRTVYATEVSRSVMALDAVLAEVELSGAGIPGRVVIHLGSNGFWPDAEQLLDVAVTQLADRRVVLVNVAVDRPWAAGANEAISAVADRHEHVTLVDWKATATAELLRSDGIHPNFDGIDVLHRMIADALGLDARSVLPAGAMAP
ncbi:MAG: hypothetical protein HKN03_06615 [Acidimicrobiales bacterium]|nr:hypothetical protein [Acidimicrobiales bacterium]